ncbi:MAG: Tripartite ATP-independent periplasmic transporter [Syntrophorhabdaceae bacterium PtaU1.Bin034]|nr:MAG: Tripartite ATP-independent periplasmic transporter [Syntrophorhabdaceae bacterium PtaU1.Bin034]
MNSRLDQFLRFVTGILNHIGSTALTVMMLLTVTDVIMRAFGHPIIGTFEIVGLLLAFVVGFTIPKVSYDRGHVFMEIVLERLGQRRRDVLNTFTRVIAFLLFAAVGYKLFGAAHEFRISGEVSPTLEIPFYPVAYMVGVCCFIECLVFINDIAKIWRGDYHE